MSCVSSRRSVRFAEERNFEEPMKLVVRHTFLELEGDRPGECRSETRRRAKSDSVTLLRWNGCDWADDDELAELSEPETAAPTSERSNSSADIDSASCQSSAPSDADARVMVVEKLMQESRCLPATNVIELASALEMPGPSVHPQPNVGALAPVLVSGAVSSLEANQDFHPQGLISEALPPGLVSQQHALMSATGPAACNSNASSQTAVQQQGCSLDAATHAAELELVAAQLKVAALQAEVAAKRARADSASTIEVSSGRSRLDSSSSVSMESSLFVNPLSPFTHMPQQFNQQMSEQLPTQLPQQLPPAQPPLQLPPCMPHQMRPLQLSPQMHQPLPQQLPPQQIPQQIPQQLLQQLPQQLAQQFPQQLSQQLVQFMMHQMAQQQIAPSGSSAPPCTTAECEVARTHPPAQSLGQMDSKEVDYTTVMLRNVPNDYTRDMLIELVDSLGLKSYYDFVYLPVDFKRNSGLGYAFLNLVSHAAAEQAKTRLQGFSDWKVSSQKVLEVSWSVPLQGLEAHIERYRNSPVMHPVVPSEFKPLLFHAGQVVPFPEPTRRIPLPKQ